MSNPPEKKNGRRWMAMIGSAFLLMVLAIVMGRLLLNSGSQSIEALDGRNPEAPHVEHQHDETEHSGHAHHPDHPEVLTLDDIPEGSLKAGLLTLSDQDRERALQTLSEHPAPQADMTNSLHVDPHGDLFYVCRVDGSDHDTDHDHGYNSVDGVGDPVMAEAIEEFEDYYTEFTGDTTSHLGIPITRAPILHSRPGSQNVIYLDFNGHVVTGTRWNDNPDFGEEEWDSRPFRYASGDKEDAVWATNVPSQIERIWSRVAEQFSTFDVDVTTEEPKNFDNRTIHVLITPRRDYNGLYNPRANTATGVSYIGIFLRSNFAVFNPLFVYSDNRTDERIAGTVAHEVGHYMGLHHDGDLDNEYYAGHPVAEGSSNYWKAIMGRSYGDMIHWSDGHYYNASNRDEDDIGIMKAVFGEAPDESNRNRGTASQLNLIGKTIRDSGVINSPDDEDWFKLVVQEGDAPVIDLHRSFGFTVDAVFELYDSTGSLVDRQETYSSSSWGSTNARFTIETPGTWFFKVSTTGRGEPNTYPTYGYTDYGSIGSYSIQGVMGADFGDIPVIIEQPKSMVAVAGTQAAFSVETQSTSSGHRFRWFYSPDGGITWKLVYPNDSPSYYGSLVIPQVRTTMNGMLLRCEVSNGEHTLVSDTVRLDVETEGPSPIVTLQPTSVYAVLPDDNQIVLDTGLPERSTLLQTISWQRKPPGEAPWEDLYTSSTTSISLNLTLDMDGLEYRCVYNTHAGIAYSNLVALTIRQGPIITTPLTAFDIFPQSSFLMKVDASQTTGSPTYQWQRRLSGEIEWTDITDGITFEGTSTGTLRIHSTDPAFDGSEWRCLVANEFGSSISDVITLTVSPEAPAGVVTAHLSMGAVLMLRSDGTLWGNGSNLDRQRGVTSGYTGHPPWQLPAEGAIAVSGTPNYTIWLQTDGFLKGIGYNTYQQLGSFDTSARFTDPVLVPGMIRNIMDIAATEKAVYFLKTDYTLWGVGTGVLGTEESFSQPVQVTEETVLLLNETGYMTADGKTVLFGRGYGYPEYLYGGVDHVYYSNYHDDYFMDLNGDLYLWKYNLPRIDLEVRDLAVNRNGVLVVDESGSLNRFSGDLNNNSIQAENVESVFAGDLNVMYTASDGWLWAYGANLYKEFGVSSSRHTPFAMDGSADVIPDYPANVRMNILGSHYLIHWRAARGARTYTIWKSRVPDPAKAELVAEGIRERFWADEIHEGEPVPYYWIKAVNHAGMSPDFSYAYLIDAPDVPIADYDRFVESEFNPTERRRDRWVARGEDADADGRTNFEEFVFHGDPHVPDATDTSAVMESGGGFVTFVRRRNLTGVDYVYEKSTDLSLWESFTPDETHFEDFGVGLERVRIPVDSTDAYYRIRAVPQN